jgi:hypothetical protein
MRSYYAPKLVSILPLISILSNFRYHLFVILSAAEVDRYPLTDLNERSHWRLGVSDSERPFRRPDYPAIPTPFTHWHPSQLAVLTVIHVKSHSSITLNRGSLAGFGARRGFEARQKGTWRQAEVQRTWGIVTGVAVVR